MLQRSELPIGVRAVESFFERRDWCIWGFQQQAWDAYAAGRSGLVHVPTGAGKTSAAYMGALAELIDEVGFVGQDTQTSGRGERRGEAEKQAPSTRGARRADQGVGLRILYLTPLRAVARDIELALRAPIDELAIPARVESRTGDTSASMRARQRARLPEVLVTTPESLSLMLTRDTARTLLAGVRCVIVDEWHELLASKRGTQTELALSRLRAFAPHMRTWALSATLANMEEAARAAAGLGAEPAIITADIDRPVEITTLTQIEGRHLPWAGFMGIIMLPAVLEALDPDRSTLIFVNTRAQAERWFQGIAMSRPEWAPIMGLHHGSIDREERERIEAGLNDGSVRLVVATSSLDLGVDFSPVERVFQIGSPKGIARLMQRAGRSGHRPGQTARVTCVPTHAMELIEIAAVRRALASGLIEPRTPFAEPVDVLAQHLVTCGMGGGFEADEMYAEVRTAWSYRNLGRETFDWTLDMVTHGGTTLGAYPEYHKLERDDSGRYAGAGGRIAQMHRLNVGTITGSAVLPIRYRNGRRLGHIEEHFVAQLRRGERFVFAGKIVEFDTIHDMTALVRPARGKTTYTPHWAGTKLPISESLAEGVREAIRIARRGELPGVEGEATRELMEAQARLSRVPDPTELLIELCETTEGRHLFAFPFDGRLVNAGLAALTALRLGRRRPATFSIAANDYGFELLGAADYPFEEHLDAALFSPEGLAADAIESVNLSQLAKRQFRDVARIAGLVFQSYPGARKTSRQVGASSELIYDVFEQFDPGNLFLGQAKREVLERQFERTRLGRSLARLHAAEITVVRTRRPTPLAYPLIVERSGGSVSVQTLRQRLEAMQREWEGAGV